MLSTVPLGELTLKGLSIGGLYTTIGIPELQMCFDAGVAPRTFAGIKRLCLSHGHVDHSGALLTLLGVRALVGNKTPLEVYMPEEIEPVIQELLATASQFQRNRLTIKAHPMRPGQRLLLTKDIYVEAFRTYHPVPSLGYTILRQVEKLRPEFRGKDGQAIAKARAAGTAITETLDKPLLCYATDTLSDVLKHEPQLFDVPTLIIESTFLDEKRSIDDARSRCHIHLDELIAQAERFRNERLVLMHFSQHYTPSQVHRIVKQKTQGRFSCQVVPLAPSKGQWPG